MAIPDRLVISSGGSNCTERKRSRIKRHSDFPAKIAPFRARSRTCVPSTTILASAISSDSISKSKGGGVSHLGVPVPSPEASIRISTPDNRSRRTKAFPLIRLQKLYATSSVSTCAQSPTCTSTMRQSPSGLP